MLYDTAAGNFDDGNTDHRFPIRGLLPMALSARLATLALFLAASFVVSLTLYAPVAVAQESPAAGAAQADAEEDKKDPVEAIIARMWWNREKIIEAATLTTEQRSRLDQLLRTAYGKKREVEVKQREGLPVFAEALKAGDRAAQSDIVEKTAQRMDQIARLRMQLMIDGVAVLSDEQRQLLAEDHAHVFNRPWLGFYSGTRPGLGRRDVRAAPARPAF